MISIIFSALLFVDSFIVTVCGLWLLQTLSVGLCVCVCVFVQLFTAYISLSMGRILIKLGENVENLVRLIVFKFHCTMCKARNKSKGWIFCLFVFFFLFIAFLVNGDTLIFFKNFCKSKYAAPDCDTSDSYLLVTNLSPIFAFLLK